MSAPVAVLGLGRMGLPMSLNLARAGTPVHAWNRTAREVPDAPDCWDACSEVEEALAGAEVIVTMLPDLEQVREVCDGRVRAGQVVVVMGTVSPVGLRAWAEGLDGVAVVDAPVSGGTVGAVEGSLSVMVGGTELDVSRVLPVLEPMASRVVHLGPLGSGQLAKACNQIVVATTLTALAEAVALGRSGGLEVDALLDVLSSGLAGSRALEVKRDLLTSHDFTPQGSAAFQHKDLGFALEAARAAGVAVPVTAMVDQLFGAMRWTGHGEDDHSGVLQMIELLSGGAR